MNLLTPISHHLFAAAVKKKPVTSMSRPQPDRPVVIEVTNQGVAPAWVNGQPVPTHPSMVPPFWLEPQNTKQNRPHRPG